MYILLSIPFSIHHNAEAWLTSEIHLYRLLVIIILEVFLCVCSRLFTVPPLPSLHQSQIHLQRGPYVGAGIQQLTLGQLRSIPLGAGLGLAQPLAQEHSDQPLQVEQWRVEVFG